MGLEPSAQLSPLTGMGTSTALSGVQSTRPKTLQPLAQGIDATGLFLLAQFPHERNEFLFTAVLTPGMEGQIRISSGQAGFPSQHICWTWRHGHAPAVRQARGKSKGHHCHVEGEAIKEDKQLCESPCNSRGISSENCKICRSLQAPEGSQTKP